MVDYCFLLCYHSYVSVRLKGIYRHQVDEKMRIRIPAKFKTQIGDNPFICAGDSGVLFVYPRDEGAKILDEAYEGITVSALSAPKEKLKEARLISAYAIDADEDNQGRILLSQDLLKHASIQKNIVTIGAHARLEIWSEEKWEEYVNGDS